MSLIDELSGPSEAVRGDEDAARVIAETIERERLREIEVMWVDHQGHARGKRIDASRFLDRAQGEGFAFCSAALTLDITGEVQSGLRHSDWETGFPDFYAVPAPTSVTWGGDNRTVAARMLVSTPPATRLELRTGAADAQPHWAIASLLAAVAAGIEAGDDPGRRGEGNLYGTGRPLPGTLADGVAAARDDRAVAEILGEDSVHDYLALAELEWEAFVGSVGEWDRDRYLRRA